MIAGRLCLKREKFFWVAMVLALSWINGVPLTAAHGTILPIPQAGLATTEEKIKTARHEIIEILKATIEGLDYTWSQREGTSEIIAKWMNLKPAQAAIVYDSVRETFSKNGVPTEEQAKAYITMLARPPD